MFAMKKLFFVFVLFATFCFNCGITYAECSNEKIAELKTKSKNIKVEYIYDPNAVFEEDGNLVSMKGGFDTKIYGLFDEVYLYDSEYEISYDIFDTNDNVLNLGFLGGGKYSFDIISKECNVSVGVVKFEIPRYNYYANDPLCDGISGDDLDVCSEWYENAITYEAFKKKVEAYKNAVNDDIKNDENKEPALNKFINFIKENLIYIIASISIVLVIIFVIFFYKKRSDLK